MSYCRWSCCDHMSDLYVFADVDGGWTALVAQGRRRWEPPEPYMDIVDDAGRHSGPESRRRYEAYMTALLDVPITASPEPSTGFEFNRETPGAMADALRQLRTEGFLIPDYAIEELDAEQKALG